MQTTSRIKRDRQSGQAMMFTIVALAVTSAIGLVAITAVIRSLATEGKLQRQAVVERLAESASEEVFGRLAKSVSSLSAITSHPGYSTGTDFGVTSSVWVRYGTDGQVVTCTLGTQACFTVRLATHGFTTAGVATADIDMATSAVIQVTARQCRDTITSAQVVARSASSADSKASCVYARRQTTIRSRLFSDHVVWVNTMANTKFASSDSIAGSIHLGTTNESFTYCGTPTIAKDTSVTPNVSYRIETLASTAVAVAGSCTSTGSQVVSASTVVSSDALALPVVSASDYASIANATISTAVTSPAAIVLSGGNYTLNGGSSTAIPSSGVLYVSGPATISQTTSLTGKLTIAASGDIAITSSLQLTSQVDDMLSIVSTAGNINIGFSAASRTIEALLLAPSLTAGQGIVQTTAANLSSATTTYPLYLYGAIVARELGALGTITATTGATTAGYSKSFTYDSRLATSQPPFALSQVRGRWIRLAATTVSPFTPGISGIATTTTAANTAPTVSFTSPATPTVSRTLSYTVTFSERISGLTSSDFSNAGTATSCTFSIPNSYGITFTLTVVCSSDGTVIVRLAASSVIDNLGLTGPSSTSDASTVTISSVATALAMETQPVGGESPTTFSTDPKIKLVNSSGDLVTTTGTTITVTASGGTLTGTTSMTTTGGYAEFTNLTLTAVAGTYTLTFASTGLTSVTSASVTVTVTAAAVTAPTSTCVTTSATTALSGISVGGLADGSTYLVSVALVNAPTGGNLQITSNSGVTAKFGYSVAINTNFTSTVFTGTLANVNAVLATLRYVSGSTNVSSTSVKVTASLENASYVLNADNGHFYYLNTNLLNYDTATTGARDAAKAMSYQGQTGYVATITSTQENSFISNNIASATNIWIGATDNLVEGTWRWDTNGGSPEAGKRFWTGTSTGSRYTADGINFASWSSGEPNNSGNEDYALTNWGGIGNATWNDCPATGCGEGRQSVVEFGTNAADNGFATGATTYSYANITLCGPATKLSTTTAAAGSVSSNAFTTQPVITIQDVSSNTVTNSAATVTASVSSGTLIGTTTATAVNGVATFSNLGITASAGTYTITYSSGSLTTTSHSITVTAQCAAGGTCIVGDTGPGGGVVFYVQASGGTFTSTGSDCATACRYLEVTTSQQSTSSPYATTAAFCYAAGSDSGTSNCQSNSIYPNSAGQAASRTAAEAIGMGMANTNQIYARLTTAGGVAASSYAAGIAWAYSNNGKTDWYLPTRSELNQMCKWIRNQAWVSDATACNSTGALNTGRNATGFLSGTYWSSTEGGLETAYNMYTPNGTQGNGYKYGFFNVRAVRAFSSVATKLATTTAAAGSVSSVAFTTQPVVTIQDVSSNTVTSSTATVTASISAGGTLIGTTTATAVNGVATFSNLGITASAGTYTITYSSGALTSTSHSITVTASCATGGTCIVGDTGPGGGVVFYVQASGGTFTSTGSDCGTACKYFEAAPRGWGNGITVASGETTGSSTVDPILKWCSNTASLRNATSKTAIGDGRSNTTTSTNSVAACTTGAIYHADLYAGGSKTDWHLPSSAEMLEMFRYNYRQTPPVSLSMTAMDNYWSSTETSSSLAVRTDVNPACGDGGCQYGQWKYQPHSVRPVRAFG